MEHDLISTYLSEILGEADRNINHHHKDIKIIEQEVSIHRDFYTSGYTKSYIVCKSTEEKLDSEKSKWCELNIDYIPLCMFVEKDHNDGYSQPRELKMVVLFKCDEDLTAYKLKFS